MVFSTSEIAASLKPCIVIVLDGLLTLPDAGAISTSAEFLLSFQTVSSAYKGLKTMGYCTKAENLVSELASLCVICREGMNTVRHPSDQDVNWRPPGTPKFVKPCRTDRNSDCLTGVRRNTGMHRNTKAHLYLQEHTINNGL